uniref:Endoplasmic reticulum-Golgi intermediate compartment protein n=1 Tax=Oryctolagus cuniculus TaxID=9986 RepID=A0A5F9CG35_RABIT
MCLQELGQLESYLLQEQFQKRAVVKTSWDACAPYRSLCSQSQLLAKAPPGGSRDGSRAASHRFDIYRKVPKDLTQPTYTGAIISICCCLFILFLFLSELTGFITTEVVNELYVDDPDKDSGGKIDVSLNLSLPNLHCECPRQLPRVHAQCHGPATESGHDTCHPQALLRGHVTGPECPRSLQRSWGSRQAHLQPPGLPRLHPEDRAHSLRGQEWQAAILVPVHSGQQGVGGLQPHRALHPSHLVPLGPEPLQGQVPRERPAPV